MMKRSAVAVLCLGLLVTPPVAAAPYTLTAADRSAIEALARDFFNAVQRGDREMVGVLPTRAELRGIFPSGVGVEGIILRHSAAMERDARALREVLRDATYVGLSERSYRNGTIELGPCGRFARATSRCGDGPTIEYERGGQRRRLRLDTLVRIGTRWRVFDIRP